MPRIYRRYDDNDPKRRTKQIAPATMLQHLADGMRISELSRKYFIDYSHMKHRINMVVRGIGARTKAHAVAIAIRKRIIQ